MARRNQKDRCCSVVCNYGLILDLSLGTRLQVNNYYVSVDGLCLWASGCFESELDATMIRALSSLLAMTRRIVFTFWSANMVLSLSVKVFIFNLRPVDTNLQHNFFEIVLLVIKVTRSTRISSCASWNALGLYVMMFPTR